MGLDKSNLDRVLMKFEAGYQNNPYHNRVHAADVCAALHWLLSAPELRDYITPLEWLGSIIAAAVHDIDHPGLNNAWHVNTNAMLAIRYNDNGVLENHHAATASQILLESKALESLTREDYLDFRKFIIDLVLSTDMKMHFEELGAFNGIIGSVKKNEVGAVDELMNDESHKRLVLKVAMHTCDVNNPTRPQDIAVKWTMNVTEE